jgi:hypothetical protein
MEVMGFSPILHIRFPSAWALDLLIETIGDDYSGIFVDDPRW